MNSYFLIFSYGTETLIYEYEFLEDLNDFLSHLKTHNEKFSYFIICGKEIDSYFNSNDESLTQ